MATATELRDIFYNVIARTGGKKGTLAEYAKAIMTMNAFKTYNEMNPLISPITPKVSNPSPLDQNQGAIPPLGDGGLNTPQNTSNGMV